MEWDITSWSGTSKMDITTPEISTFAPVKLFSVRGSTLSNMRDQVAPLSLKIFTFCELLSSPTNDTTPSEIKGL